MTDKINVTRYTDERKEEMIAFIARMNNDPRHHIAYFGAGEADVRASLAENIIPLTDGFFLAYEGGRLAGVFGLDVNLEIGRAWLLGPLVDSADWDLPADELFAAVNAVIPRGVRQHELYFDVENQNLHTFAGRHGFNPRAESGIYYVAREDYRPPAVNDTRVIDFEDDWFEKFESLHNALFPNTYYTAKQIVEKCGEDRRLFIAIEEQKLLGYNFCKVEDGFGYIDFIGVDESARRRGVASALLASGLDWMLARPAIGRVNLTMNTDRQPARNLYDKFGFKCERVTIGYRKEIPHV